MQATFQHMGKPSENAVVENASILMNSTGIPSGVQEQTDRRFFGSRKTSWRKTGFKVKAPRLLSAMDSIKLKEIIQRRSGGAGHTPCVDT